MEKVLSTIKNSLGEAKQRVESGKYENHDLLPSLLLILVELLEQNKQNNENYIDSQKSINENESNERTQALSDIMQENKKFLGKINEITESENKERDQKYLNLITKQE